MRAVSISTDLSFPVPRCTQVGSSEIWGDCPECAQGEREVTVRVLATVRFCVDQGEIPTAYDLDKLEIHLVSFPDGAVVCKSLAGDYWADSIREQVIEAAIGEIERRGEQ